MVPLEVDRELGLDSQRRLYADNYITGLICDPRDWGESKALASRIFVSLINPGIRSTGQCDVSVSPMASHNSRHNSSSETNRHTAVINGRGWTLLGGAPGGAHDGLGGLNKEQRRAAQSSESVR